MPGPSPTFEKPWTIERTSHDTVAVAANLLALCAYPRRDFLQCGGPAHRFRDAQLAWLARGAKEEGKMQRLPSWALKSQQQQNVLKRGTMKLLNMRMAHLLFIELILVHTTGDARIQIVFSPDFSRMTTSLSIDSGNLVRPNPNHLDTVQAAIKYHLPAFGLSDNDYSYAIKDVRRRLLYPYLGIAPIFFQLHNTFTQLTEAFRPLSPELFLTLVLNPSWADDAIERAQRSEPLIIALARQVGMTWFSEKNLIRVREQRFLADC